MKYDMTQAEPHAVWPDLEYVHMDDIEEYMADAGRGDDFKVVHIPIELFDIGPSMEAEIYRYLKLAVYG